MILLKNFMVKVKPRLSDFESIWCNTNDSGSIVAAPDFSKVTILVRKVYVHAVYSFNKIFIKGYKYKFKFYI